MKTMSYYLVRVGEGAKYAEEAKKGGYIAIGWNQVPDLTAIKTLEKVKSFLVKACPECSAASIATQAGQIYRFGFEVMRDDIILVPLGGRRYLVGKAGEYYFDISPKDGCPYQHRRKIEWLDKALSKDDMTTNLAYAIGSSLTIFSLNNYAPEIEALISGQPSVTPAEAPQTIRDVILDGLMNLDGKEFEEFVRHLLSILGFQATTTPYVGDKGIDVNGILDAEGLAEIVLRVQVKRVHGAIGNKDVLAIRGATGQGEHACLVALSGFTGPAREEASAPGKTSVKLVDGDELAAIILKNFDEIDEEYRELFPIARKKEIHIEDQFEFIEPRSKTVVSGEVRKTAGEITENEGVDTLVCAAREEGFKRAFLGQKAWWAVRVSARMIPSIKYLAMYQVAPISGITHYGEVDRLEPFEDTGKYKIYLKGEPVKLEKPIGIGKNRLLKPQGIKYASFVNIRSAKTLDDVFG
jgi:restriction system protein